MATFKFSELPPVLSAYTYLGFLPEQQIGNEYLGNCPICHRSEKKFYVNGVTGQFSCKHGSCGVEGNLKTFIPLAFKSWLEDDGFGEATASDWNALSEDRKMSIDLLKSMELILVNGTWLIPSKDPKGKIFSFRSYKVGKKVLAIKGLPVGLQGIEQFNDPSKQTYPVYVTEGQWDPKCLEQLLKENSVNGLVIGAPGVGIFKDEWLHNLQGREVISCFDKDEAGVKGTKKFHEKIRGIARSQKYIEWPADFPEGFDIRDFCATDNTFADLASYCQRFTVNNKSQAISEKKEVNDDSEGSNADDYQSLYPSFDYSIYANVAENPRPHLDTVISTFKKHLKMTPEMEAALRVMFAVVITAQMPDDPLWIHFAAPPGWAKTELLLPCANLACGFFADTLTEASLISGARLKGGQDPSYIPQFFGKTLILKDFTEILQAPKPEKDGVFRILRGAYDGTCSRIFGNGVPSRRYTGYFNCMTGVTHEIFGDMQASMGERFLIFKVSSSPDNLEQENAMNAAIDNLGKKGLMRQELNEAVASFLERKIDEENLPTLKLQHKKQIIAMAGLLSMLRATVSQDHQRRYVNYRPQTEIGTRPAKQLTKLAIGLGLQRYPAEITDEDMRIVQHVALSSCIAWNLEAVSFLVQKPRQTVDELSNKANIPVTTLREHMEQLFMIGVLNKHYAPNPIGTGRSIAQYEVADRFRQFWLTAGIPEYCMYKPGINQIRGLLSVPSISAKLSKKRLRKVTVTDEPLFEEPKPKVKLRRKKK